ncbi:MAG: hypothetical protein ACI3YM_02980 [Prevotella sp.]
MSDSNKIKIQSILSDLFNKHRFIFWYDDSVRDDLSQAQRNKANKLAAELANKVREVKEFADILAQMSTQRLTIDLDDGVKTNYPKYYPLVEPIKGLESKDE